MSRTGGSARLAEHEARVVVDAVWRDVPGDRYHVVKEQVTRQRGRDIGDEPRARVRRARDRAVVTLLLFTGLRIAELVALDVDDLLISAGRDR